MFVNNHTCALVLLFGTNCPYKCRTIFMVPKQRYTRLKVPHIVNMCKTNHMWPKWQFKHIECQLFFALTDFLSEDFFFIRNGCLRIFILFDNFFLCKLPLFLLLAEILVKARWYMIVHDMLTTCYFSLD
jgi:hypothetical protein